MTHRRRSWLGIIGPGLLVAATGVGAGDLATGAFAGSRLGTAVLWAVVAGALLKFVLNEGLARWQLATGQTLLEGAITRLGWPVRIVFILYLLPWSFFVGAALISACGVTTQALLPVFDDAATGKLVLGAGLSAIGVILSWFGGFRVVERVMAVAIGVMFVCVVWTAARLGPDVGAMLSGIAWPRIPEWRGEGLTWTIALMGGVGGTLTVLCYGYWIREAGRTRAGDLRTCRIDLACAYVMTAIFGLAMVAIASGLELDGTGSGLIVNLAAQIEQSLGAAGRWVFLVGAWAAVFSSLLGVWQAVPYIFADYWQMTMRGPGAGQPDEDADAASRAVNTRAWPYRVYLLALATVPIVQVGHPFREVQKYYAVMGAAFLPLLALVLLVMNGRRDWVGARFTNRPLTVAVLIAALAMSVAAGWLEIRRRWG
ncbi:MAG: Nramp family divalent metal transporter [Planctomycetota bacterium]|jgi:Mn2+/Fe2+ NRAMP family transporter